MGKSLTNHHTSARWTVPTDGLRAHWPNTAHTQTLSCASHLRDCRVSGSVRVVVPQPAVSVELIYDPLWVLQKLQNQNTSRARCGQSMLSYSPSHVPELPGESETGQAFPSSWCPPATLPASLPTPSQPALPCPALTRFQRSWLFILKRPPFPGRRSHR